MRRIAGFVIAALTVTALLTGCAQSPNTVAVVDGTVITEDQLADVAAACVTVVALSEADCRSNAAQWLVAAAVYDRVSEKSGLTAPDDLLYQIANSSQSILALLQDETAAEPFAGELGLYIMSTLSHLSAADLALYAPGGFDTEAYLAALDDTSVDLNPLYGRWSAADGGIVTPGYGLAAPVDSVA